MKDRVYNDKIDIDYGKTLDFFEHRGDNKLLNTKYNYVLFQDDSPEIAVKRDKEEKEKIGKRVYDRQHLPCLHSLTY